MKNFSNDAYPNILLQGNIPRLLGGGDLKAFRAIPAVNGEVFSYNSNTEIFRRSTVSLLFWGEKFPPMPKMVRPVDERGRVVLPKDLLDNWKCREVALHPNAFAALVTPKGADLKKVIRSVEILLEDLKNQAEV